MLARAYSWVSSSVEPLHLLVLCAAGFALLWQVHARRHYRQAFQELLERTQLTEVRVHGEPSDSMFVQGCPIRLRLVTRRKAGSSGACGRRSALGGYELRSVSRCMQCFSIASPRPKFFSLLARLLLSKFALA